MSFWADVRERVRGVLRSEQAHDELREEMEFHIEQDVAQRMRAGASREAARRAALRTFGNVDEHRERARDARGARPAEDLLHDVRYAVRTLRRNPAFTVAAVLVLALGIGANTAIFSAVNAVVLKPLAFAQPERLFMVWEENEERGWYQETAAPANMLDWRARVASFEDVAGYESFSAEAILTGRGDPRFVDMQRVTGNFFSVLGVRAALGRTFADEETWSGGERVVVLSHDFWQQTFGGDAGILNQTIELGGEAVRVVGVMPRGFAFPSQDVQAWLPMEWETEMQGAPFFRRAHWLRVIARLTPDATEDQARAQLVAVARQLETEYPDLNAKMGAGLTPLQEFLVGKTRTPLLVLLGAVGLLLLVGCANVGNLLLVKAAGRQREIAVRSALGAGRGRLVRQMLTESLVLALVAGVVGLALGTLGTGALTRLVPSGMLNQEAIGVDARVVLFVLAVSVGAGMLFGLLPALWTRRASDAVTLREGGRSGALGRSARKTAGLLVVGEVAVALLLVVGAGLLLRSVQKLLSVHPGFDTSGVLVVRINLPESYDTPEKTTQFFAQLEERVRGLAAVESVGMTDRVPLAASGYTSDFAIAGRAPDAHGTGITNRVVSPDYFRTMRVPLLRGRTFTDDDRADTERVVILNDEVARRFFASEDPIGQRIAFERMPDSTSTWWTIVGIVRGERQLAVGTEPTIEVFYPLEQDSKASMSLLVRTTGEPMAVLPAVEAAVGELDANLPIYSARTLESVRTGAVARERFLMILLVAFAGTALVLAIVGVYGVIAQFVRQRRHEIGVRLALRAQPAQVVRMIVARGAALVGAGIVIGTIAALAASRTLATVLYDIAPNDPATYLAVIAILAVTGVATAWIPALRASRTDPGIALRPE